MDETIIRSTANPLIKRIRALEQRKQREAQRVFFVEGIAPVWRAVESGAEIETLVVAPDLLKSGGARHLVDEQARQGTRVAHVSRAVYESIASRENPSGLGAVVRMTPHALADLKVTPQSFFVALHQVGNPGNLGTILRTSDAVGGSGVVLIGDATDEHHPTAVKASMGALFTVPVARVKSLVYLTAWCKAHKVRMVTTSSRADTPYWSVNYALPALFLFGSEGEGLDDDTLKQSDVPVRIPMTGKVDSLNLAVAVGVLLYEIKRQLTMGQSTTD